jgi:hypothetical protein
LQFDVFPAAGFGSPRPIEPILHPDNLGVWPKADAAEVRSYQGEKR